MKNIITWLVVVAVLAGLVWFALEFSREEEPAGGPRRQEEPALETVPDPALERADDRGAPDADAIPDRVNVPAEQGEASRLEGKVTDIEGRPVAGARVVLFSYAMKPPPLVGDVRPQHSEVERARTGTGPDGRYLFTELGDVEAPIFSMRIEAEGYSEVLKDGVGPGMVVDARLERGNPLEIQAVDAATGAPVAGALLDISMHQPGASMHDYRRWRRRIPTDDEGRVQLAGVPSGRLTLLLDHPDYEWLHVKPDDEVWVGHEKKGSLVFRMKRGLVFEGTVVDAGTKEPVRDCIVTLRELIIASRREKTGVFGRFKMAGVNRGLHEVNLEAPGYTRYQARLEFSDQTMAEPLVFELVPAGMASGTVLDDQGNPVAGARIYVAEARSIFRAIRGESEAETDRSGTFSVRDLHDGVIYRIVASSPGFSLGASREFIARSGEFVDGVVVQLERGAEIQGLVRDQAGVPIAGAVVTVERPPYSDAWFPPGMSAGQKETVSLVTDERGYWKIEGLWTGPHQITVEHGDFVPMLPEEVRIETADQKLEKNFSLYPGHFIEGRVFLPSGEPAGGVEVRGSIGAFQARVTATRTDPEGRYRLTRLLERPYRVKAIGPQGVAPEQEDVPYDSRGIDFRLESYGAIEGTVMAYEGATPIDRFVVRLYPLMALAKLPDDRRGDPRFNQKQMNSHEAFVEKTVVSPEGRFTIDRVHPGSYRVEVEAENRVMLAQEPIVVNPAGIGRGQPFVLRAGAALQGRVVDSDGKPISGNELVIRIVPAPNSTLETTIGPDGQPVLQQGRTPWTPRTVKIDPEGRYFSGGLPPGRLRIQLNSQSYCCPPWEDVTFGKEGVIERDYKLLRAAKVVLNVSDQFGNPVELPAAQVYDLEGEQAKVDDRVVAARGDSRGKTEIAKVAPGRYQIELQCYGYQPTRLELELREGEQLTRDVEMEKLAR